MGTIHILLSPSLQHGFLFRSYCTPTQTLRRLGEAERVWGGGRRLGEGKGGWGAIVLRKQQVLLFLLPLTCGLGCTQVLLCLCFRVKTPT